MFAFYKDSLMIDFSISCKLRLEEDDRERIRINDRIYLFKSYGGGERILLC